MRSVTLVAGALLVGITFSCTYVFNESTTQCRSEEDCRSRGPAFADTTCSLERVCVKLVEEQQLCSSNTECSEKNGGAAYRCLPDVHRCVPIATPECPRILGDKQDYLDDNAIFFGLSYPNDANGIFTENAVEVARQELKAALQGGLPPLAPGGPKRPLVINGCPNNPIGTFGSVAEVTAGTRHFVQDLNASVMFGPLTPSGIQAAQPFIVPGNMAAIVYGYAPDFVTDYDTKGLLYQFRPNFGVIAKVLPYFINEVVEPRVKNENIAAPGEDVRIQIIGATDRADKPLVDEITGSLKWNGGKTAFDPTNVANFKFSDLGDTTDPTVTPDVIARADAAIADALTFHPHIIIYPMNPQSASVLTAIEVLWPQGVPRPIHYVVRPEVIFNLIPVMNAAPVDRVDFVKRFYLSAVDPPVRSPARLAQFNVSLLLRFPQAQPQVETTPAVTAYEALYAAAYAVVGAGATELSGDVVARNLKKLTGGAAVQTGPGDIVKAVTALQSGQTIQLQTMTGNLGWSEKNVTTIPENPDIYCWSVDNKGLLIFSPRVSGYYLDLETGKTPGASVMTCP